MEPSVKEIPRESRHIVAKQKHYQGVVIGIPTFGMMSDTFSASAQTMAMPIFLNCGYHYVRGKPVDVARNEIAFYALSGGAGFVFFRDDDTIVPRDALMKMINRIPPNERKDPKNLASMMISGVVYSKTEPPTPMIFRENHTGGFEDWELGDFFEADATGMGCALIPVGCFEKTMPYVRYWQCINADCPVNWQERYEGRDNCPHCQAALVPMWFRTIRDHDDDGNPCYMTEDAYFQQKLKKAGIKIYVDCAVQCQHEVFNPDPRQNKLYYYHQDVGPCWQIGSYLYYYPSAGDEVHTKMALDTKPAKKRKGKIKYNLGSGGVNKKGFINVDLHVPSDFPCDIRNLAPLVREHGQADEINASHVLEWLKALKPGGKLTVEVPDFVWTMENCLKDRTNGKALDELSEAFIFGRQANPGDFHKVGFDEKRIKALMAACKNQIGKYTFKRIFPKGYNQQVIRLTVWKKEAKKKNASAKILVHKTRKSAQKKRGHRAARLDGSKRSPA
jgi:hypothetical protein